MLALTWGVSASQYQLWLLPSSISHTMSSEMELIQQSTAWTLYQSNKSPFLAWTYTLRTVFLFLLTSGSLDNRHHSTARSANNSESSWKCVCLSLYKLCASVSSELNVATTMTLEQSGKDEYLMYPSRLFSPNSSESGTGWWCPDDVRCSAGERMHQSDSIEANTVQQFCHGNVDYMACSPSWRWCHRIQYDPWCVRRDAWHQWWDYLDDFVVFELLLEVWDQIDNILALPIVAVSQVG